ncbi:outer dense fiber protein 3-B [Cheilinus undulatus]|uniref:outer dense fiber protein 3-B n=1 Tax=Cheilinus undulatus TaxID=241271 RepID=UPI001BD1F5AD|nr:outer dense fiber protein 3-B [Cheilinus undulatus]
MSDAGGWVGTWRPHKPRGPIAALYGSPGPKYALPGLTGNTKHDPTRLKAPMFSFGVCTHQSSANFSPGPRYLIPSNMTRVGQDGSPAFSLLGRPKDPEAFKTPGPGEYFPENVGKWIFRSSPAYSLSARSTENRIDQSPGPAAHTLPPVFGPKTVGRATAPCYSISGRSKSVFSEDMKDTPGPASYKAVDPYIYMPKPPNFSMTGRNHTPGDSTKKPGPGAHYPERVTNTRAKAPSFSFGLRHSQYIAPFIDHMHE